jgi:hypothetical protein
LFRKKNENDVLKPKVDVLIAKFGLWIKKKKKKVGRGRSCPGRVTVRKCITVNEGGSEPLRTKDWVQWRRRTDQRRR